MTPVTVFGAGAFGTALAISLARDKHEVTLVARNAEHAAQMTRDRQNRARLPAQAFPPQLSPVAGCDDPAPVCLIAVPAQSLSDFVSRHRDALGGRAIVACCKGVDLKTGLGATALITRACPDARAAILSGPGFAADIAAGLPTALTIAARDEALARVLQSALSTTNLRLYRSSDVVGVELGGALKNIIAIAAGVAIGAGLGESARAALITRGYAEIKRYALHFGARASTLSGLSGFGDLVLTCTSARSRNYALGLDLGGGRKTDESLTTEGVATAISVSNLAKTSEIEMPVTDVVAALLDGRITVEHATRALFTRPLKEE
ncbi:MAG: NAD(P)H-dependent glycerol-3-phosphate dehydrogenase [Paracoccaceae bacterium]